VVKRALFIYDRKEHAMKSTMYFLLALAMVVLDFVLMRRGRNRFPGRFAA
jgi:hypothetical protein